MGKARPKIYAVRVGRRPGIYHSWKEAMSQVSRGSCWLMQTTC